MGFLRGPGSLQFKWGVAKAIFPELTKTYYRNTWNRRPKAPRTHPAAGTQLFGASHIEFAPPTSAEQKWIASFTLFATRLNALKTIVSPEGNKQLFLLLTAARGAQDLHSEFFGASEHSKAFIDAYIKWCKEVIQLVPLVECRVPRSERVQIANELGGTLRVDFDTWTEIVEVKKKWWQFWH